MPANSHTLRPVESVLFTIKVGKIRVEKENSNKEVIARDMVRNLPQLTFMAYSRFFAKVLLNGLMGHVQITEISILEEFGQVMLQDSMNS